MNQLKLDILRVWDQNFRLSGVDKIWAQLNRERSTVARCPVERLMRELGLKGVVRGRRPRTTTPADASIARPRDLVERAFSAPAPNRLWLADITYVRTWTGFVYVSFVIDCFARMIVGWQAARSLRTDLCLDALEQAIWSRHNHGLKQLVHHSDRGVQYLSIRYTERVAGAGAVSSVGSRGDSYDNALVESVIGLYKTELVRNKGAWRGLDDVEIATLEWVDWWRPQETVGADRADSTGRGRGRLLQSGETRGGGRDSRNQSLYETRGGSQAGAVTALGSLSSALDRFSHVVWRRGARRVHG